MSLPTLLKTWQFKPNVAITATGTPLNTNKTILRSIKDGLISGSGWFDNTNSPITASNMLTVYYSCNASVAGTAGDGVDRWSANSDLTWANAGTAHSWIVLKSTQIGSNFQMLITLEAAAGNGQSLTVYQSIAAGFTGGSTTNRPTATDEAAVLSSGTWGGAVNTDTNVKLHFMKSSDGEVWVVVCANGGQPNTGLLFGKARVIDSAKWSNPAYTFWLGAAGATSVFSNANLYSTPNFVGRAASNMTMYLATLSAGLGVLNVVETTADDQSLTWDFIGQALYSNTASNKGIKGELYDLWYGSTTLASGSTFPSSTTPLYQFVQLGSLIFPWCQTPIVMS